MRKIISIILITTILFYSIASNYVVVNASDGGEVTDDTYVTALALPFSMLDAILYSIAGQQAYDTYSDEENQQALHNDFVNFCDEIGYGAEVNFKINMMNAYMVKTNLQECVNWYKTSGSSALSELSEEAKRNFNVITGGSNSDENNNGDDEKTAQIASATSTALVTHIANYVDELVQGNRGEVSETFVNGGQEVPVEYFNGDYVVVGNDMYIRISGKILDSHTYASGYKFYDGFNELKLENYLYAGYYGTPHRIAFYVNKEWGYFGRDGYYRPYVYAFCDGTNEIKEIRQLGNISNPYTYVNTGSDYALTQQFIAIHESALPNITGVPVFITWESMQYYMETGDASGAINYFEGVEPKEEWYDFDFSKITNKLDDILKSLATLPLITTESLSGFAQGVNQQVARQITQQSTPQAQEEAVKKALEDNAKKIATEQLAENALVTDEEMRENEGLTPKPTMTPDEEVDKKQAQMIVDLHDFFPFCIPYDFVHLLQALNATPKAPKFEGNILIMGKKIPVTLDLAQFEPLANTFRTFETILFILGLILITRNLIRG